MLRVQVLGEESQEYKAKQEGNVKTEIDSLKELIRDL